MNRLQFVDFNTDPIHAMLLMDAEPGYKGFFHYHQGIELLYVHQGEGSVVLDQHVYKIEPGTLFLFQPYQLHYVKAATESASYVRSILHFEPNALTETLQSLGGQRITLKHIWKDKLETQVFRGFGERHPIEPLYEYYKQLLCETAPEGCLPMLEALLIQLLVFLKKETASSLQNSASSTRPTSHVEAILEWIEAQFHSPFKLEALANDLHLSKYHVSHLFREETGHSITDYLIARRVQAACLLLATTELPVETVGAEVGWPIPSHFGSQFRKWVGCTPRQYRTKQKNLLLSKM